LSGTFYREPVKGAGRAVDTLAEIEGAIDLVAAHRTVP
jgi:hypothetical protein